VLLDRYPYWEEDLRAICRRGCFERRERALYRSYSGIRCKYVMRRSTAWNEYDWFDGGPNDHKSRMGCKRKCVDVLKVGLVIQMILEGSFVEGGGGGGLRWGAMGHSDTMELWRWALVADKELEYVEDSAVGRSAKASLVEMGLSGEYVCAMMWW